jgi:hypothetical protein
MKLLGKNNWYFPTWLEWLPRMGIEGTPVPSAGRSELRTPARPAATTR